MGLKYRLGPYLNQTSTNVFIVLDGLDEANFSQGDPVQTNESEIAILLNYLANLSNLVRVLRVIRKSLPSASRVYSTFLKIAVLSNSAWNDLLKIIRIWGRCFSKKE
jgi:hypothetical protein